MKNSTFSQNIKKVDANRYIECFICEQNLIGVGIGVACRDRTIAFASTFACFLTRAFDNLRMGVISQTNLNVMVRGGSTNDSLTRDGLTCDCWTCDCLTRDCLILDCFVTVSLVTV